MSVRPLEMELERGTSTRKPRSSCLTDFAGTLCSLLVSVPLLIWVFFHVVKIISEMGPLCELLLDDHPLAAAAFAMIFIFVVFLAHLRYVVSMEQPFAVLGVMLVLCASIVVFSGFPNLESKPPSLRLYHSSSLASAAVVGTHNNSEYWRNNIRTCLCRTKACEDLVYREYFLRVYDDLDFPPDFFGYTKLDLEVKRFKPLAQDLNRTMAKNEDSPSPSFASQYHEVCYSKSSRNKENKIICYGCYGCEERYLRDKNRSLWSCGNKLSILSLLLVVSNVIVFVAESWARYMG